MEAHMDMQANRSGIAGNLWLQMIGLAVVVAALNRAGGEIRLVKPLRAANGLCRRALGVPYFASGYTSARRTSHCCGAGRSMIKPVRHTGSYLHLIRRHLIRAILFRRKTADD